jgi:hypothetical protein
VTSHVQRENCVEGSLRHKAVSLTIAPKGFFCPLVGITSTTRPKKEGRICRNNIRLLPDSLGRSREAGRIFGS